MKKRVAAGSAMILLVAVVIVLADGGFKKIKEVLNGFKEVPVISTTGHGEFQARISNDDSQITYVLTYADIQGGSAAQAHIHFGPPNNTGGISVWLCANPALLPPTTVIPPGTQACPLVSGTISGTITAANVIGPTNQGIGPGELDELIAAIRAGKTYVNVHSTTWPAGEIRSQIDNGEGHDHDGDDGAKK
jgi:hypothetical protein